MRNRYLAAGICLLAVACQGDANDAARGQTPALVPSMMPPPASNADASPPAIPFANSTPVAIAHARASWPHDTAAYTQGLVLNGRHLIESTGREGRSDLRQVEQRTGWVVHRTRLPAAAFGEGIAVASGRVYQLTWKGGRGYVYDAGTLALADSFAYTGEGWGLASDGALLYMSNGSSEIRVIDPAGFRELRRFRVTEAGKPVWMLNELEFVDGELWANIYETNLIARITPSGHIIGYIDLGQLLTAKEQAGVERRGGVANGIAFDPAHNSVLVTGKLWPRLFELDLNDVPKPATPGMLQQVR